MKWSDRLGPMRMRMSKDPGERKSWRGERRIDSSIDLGARLRYDSSMHLISKPLWAVAFVVFSGCGAATPGAKSSDGGASETDVDVKQAECNAVENKFKQIDEAVKGVKGAAAGKALVPALEKMAKEFKESPMKTPGLDKATVELTTEADSFTAKMKELNAAFDEMEKVNAVLQTWQTKVEKVAEEFDVACGKAPKEECEAMGKRVTNIPNLEGDGYGKYADELERFVKTTGEYEIKDAGLRTSTKNMLGVLSEAVKPMRRLDELMTDVKKRDPGAAQLKAKFNQVREMCGLPVRK